MCPTCAIASAPKLLVPSHQWCLNSTSCCRCGALDPMALSTVSPGAASTNSNRVMWGMHGSTAPQHFACAACSSSQLGNLAMLGSRPASHLSSLRFVRCDRAATAGAGGRVVSPLRTPWEMTCRPVRLVNLPTAANPAAKQDSSNSRRSSGCRKCWEHGKVEQAAGRGHLLNFHYTPLHVSHQTWMTCTAVVSCSSTPKSMAGGSLKCGRRSLLQGLDCQTGNTQQQSPLHSFIHSCYTWSRSSSEQHQLIPNGADPLTVCDLLHAVPR
jgi:hypothetical protein